MPLLLCPVNNCKIAFGRRNVILSHIRNDHNPLLYASGLHCKMSGCNLVVRSYHAFRMHLSRKHKTVKQFASISTDAATGTINFTLYKLQTCQRTYPATMIQTCNLLI